MNTAELAQHCADEAREKLEWYLTEGIKGSPTFPLATIDGLEFEPSVAQVGDQLNIAILPAIPGGNLGNISATFRYVEAIYRISNISECIERSTRFIETMLSMAQGIRQSVGDHHIRLYTRRLPTPIYDGTGFLAAISEDDNLGIRLMLSYDAATLQQKVTVGMLYAIAYRDRATA